MRKGIVVACCFILVITCGHGVALQEEHPSGSSTEVRIFAAYFPYGRGIAEGFAYHPGEQDVGHTGDPNSEKLAAIFYGNKFVHVMDPFGNIEGGIFWGLENTCAREEKKIVRNDRQYTDTI
jgi:hypothetical protein